MKKDHSRAGAGASAAVQQAAAPKQQGGEEEKNGGAEKSSESTPPQTTVPTDAAQPMEQLEETALPAHAEASPVIPSTQ